VKWSCRSKRPIVLHPFLLAIYPVLLYAMPNLDVLDPGGLVRPLAALLAAQLVAYLLLRAILHDALKSGLAASLAVFLLFTARPLRFALGDLVGLDSPKRVIAVLYVLYYFLCVYTLSRSSWPFVRITHVLNVFSLTLVLLALITIGQHEYRAAAVHPDMLLESGDLGPVVAAASQLEAPPDVYWLVYERYASKQTLKEFYAYDNSQFLRALSNMGFYVVPSSHAPMPATALLVICLIYYAACVHVLVGSPRDFVRATRVLNVFTLILVVLACWSVAASEWEAARVNPKSLVAWEKVNEELECAVGPESPPDIYYFVYDRYGSRSVM